MTRKIICAIVLIVMISLSISMLCNNIYAAGTVDEVMEGANGFLKAGKDAEVNGENLSSASDFIYNLLLAIAIIIAVVIGMVLGIQFMMAGIEEKAKIKETLIPYVAGCIVVFGAFGIWKLGITVFSQW